MDTATIYFIGLALFSTAVPGEQGALRVLLPHIEQHRDPAHQHVRVGGRPDRLVEAHVAAIIVKDDDLLQQIGWSSQPVPAHMLNDGAAAHRMLMLDGDQLTFMASANNSPLDTSQLVLPKLRCATKIAQQTDVAALVKIPAGTVSSCSVNENGTYYSILKLQNQSVMTLWAESTARSRTHTRALVLKGNATVYVVNVPVAAIDETQNSGTVSHYLAYYSLLRTKSASCKRGLIPAARPATACDSIPLSFASSRTATRFADPTCTIVNWP